LKKLNLPNDRIAYFQHILKNLKFYLASIVAFSIWGSFALVLKPINSYASLDILFYRVFSCAVIMSIISIFFKRQKIKENIQLFQSLPKAKKQSIAWLNVGASIFLTFNWFSFIYAMNHITVRATSLAYLICPILTIVLSYFILQEKLNRFQWFSVLLSCIGCLVLSYSSMINMVYSSIIGLSYAFYLISQNKNTGFDKFLVLNFHILLSALLLTPFYPKFAGPIPMEFKFYLYVEIIAVFYTIVPLFLNLYALSGISSATVGTILNINPIIAFTLSVIVYHEPLGILQIFAYSIIVIAVIVFNVSRFIRKTT
jgi:chloramphenicol-sensitive protein RarD